jgi:hypothetical protein
MCEPAHIHSKIYVPAFPHAPSSSDQPTQTQNHVLIIWGLHTEYMWEGLPTDQLHILLDLHAPSFPVFLLEGELYGTWAAIVQNTEVKGYREATQIVILPSLGEEEGRRGSCFVL